MMRPVSSLTTLCSALKRLNSAFIRAVQLGPGKHKTNNQLTATILVGDTPNSGKNGILESLPFNFEDI